MKVGIDTFGCDHARSGLGTYLLSFVSNLKEDCEDTIELFGSELDKFTYTSGKDIPYKSVEISDTLNAERLWHFTSVNKFARSQKYDAILYTAPEKVLPLRYKVPGIVVVNTLISKHLKAKGDFFKKLQLKKGLCRASLIIAGTQYIKQDLIKCGIRKDKIKVIHNGIDHKLFFPALETSGDIVDIKPFAIKKPYFIYGSSLSGSDKKHIELIKAFDLFKDRTQAPHRLVIAGSDGEGSNAVHKAALESSHCSDIFITGYFPHESFAKLYSNADACVFPAVNEGVALPVLEAMATGVPVLCSDSGALKEACEDAALYFNSDNVEEISQCMEKILNDADLKEELIKKGFIKAEDRTWSKTVTETLKAIHQVTKNK